MAPADSEPAADPARLAVDLVADEGVVRDPYASEEAVTAAAHRQQRAYRILSRHAEWAATARSSIPPALLAAFDRNLGARRNLDAMAASAPLRTTLPTWRIVAPTPAPDLMRYYRDAEAESRVDWTHLAAIHSVETLFGRVAGISPAGARGPMQFLPSTFAAYGEGGDIDSPRDSILAAGRFLAAHGYADDPDAALFRYNNSQRYVRAVDDYAAVLSADPAAFAGYYHWQVYIDTPYGDVLLPVGYDEASPLPVAEFLGRRSPSAEMRMTGRSGERIDQMLASVPPDAPAGVRGERLSRAFLDTPYGAGTLIGSASEPERLVVDTERVDCFTLADYVETLKRSRTRADVVDALATVRYRDGVVGFATRRHFFTDWAATAPTIATDVTSQLSVDAVPVTKVLNRTDAGGSYLLGLPPVPRDMSYIPTERVDDAVLRALRTGDYLGAYAEDGGLDVTHVGIVVLGPGGPVLRNASSLDADERVVDTPLADYLPTVPGIVVLRPVR